MVSIVDCLCALREHTSLCNIMCDDGHHLGPMCGHDFGQNPCFGSTGLKQVNERGVNVTPRQWTISSFYL